MAETSLTKVRELAGSRLRIIALVPRAGGGLVSVLVTANVLLGLLPLVFVFSTSVVLGRLPAAIAHGTGSAAWRSLLAVFGVSAAAFVLQQVISPLVTSLGELVARRIDGQLSAELMAE